MRSFLLAIAACLMFCAAAEAQTYIYLRDNRGGFSYGYTYGYRPPCRHEYYQPPAPYVPYGYQPYYYQPPAPYYANPYYSPHNDQRRHHNRGH